MKGKYLLVILLIVMALAIGISASADSNAERAGAQGEVKSYVVVMEGLPIAAYDGSVDGYEATKPGKGQKINPNSAHVRKYEQFLLKKQNASLAEAGVDQSAMIHSYVAGMNGYSAVLTEAEANEIAAQKDVSLVLDDIMRQPDTDSSPEFLGLTEPGGAYLKGFTGEGVVVGIIDSGIWPEHPSFADDGTFPPAPVLDDSRPNCEFGNTAHNANDLPFECNNKLIGARQMLDTYRFFIGATPGEYDSARDDNGHGTHTASTAAGNAGVAASMYGIPRGIVSGVAPRAHIVAYKGLGGLGGFTSDLAAAIDQAVLDGVDVINYSIGGGAATPGADEISFLFAAAAGVDVATSAGNSGSGAATLGNPGTMPWMTTVGASTQSRFFQGTAILGNGDSYVGASITPGVGSSALVDAEFHGGDLCVPGTLDAGVAGKIVLCRRGAIARADKSQAVALAGGVGMIMYENTDDNSLFSDSHWVPSVHIDNTPGLAIKAYIAAAGASASAEIVAEQYGEWSSAPSMTYFSSRGPNPVAPDIIKPDITAPGIQILAGNTPLPDGGMQGELFQAIAGTSMSSPHVAGIFALLNQAHPEWSPAEMKSALMTTAYQDVRDNDRVSQADPFDMGSGHANPGGQWGKGSISQPGLAYDAGLFEYAAFTCGMNWGVFTSGSCAFLESIGVPTAPTDLNVPSIGVAELLGSKTVKRTVTSVASESGWRTYNVSVDAPEGFDVTVSPSSFSLKSGQSATYNVTITNNGATEGVWQFGSLTWSDTDGHYDVYSPIAVKAEPFLIDAPASINGIGENAGTSFGVRFGYTGDYTAAAHGLEAAMVTSDNVVQDPDQNFDPTDGFSNRHDFTLSGDAFLRIAMPPESVSDPDAIDLDIFLFDPSGTMVAASTSGGTNELIEIVAPVDGIWSLYVHGWQTAGPSADYLMWTWAVSATPGGNMSVDSAPASAVTNATGTVDISWTGATAGQWHLGAISHSDASGVLSLTLVEVDNR